MKKVVKKESNQFFYLLFLVTIFFTQFSYINQEVIDWDESTFFVISKYLAHGDLLYVDYWDGKPPLIFFYLGIVFKFFGSSLLVGRLAGDFLIFLNVILIFKILDKNFSKFVSVSSSLFLIYLFSYKASQPTMTEHLGILFIVFSFFLISNNNFTNYYYLGVLFSLAFNTRNNLAFACLGIVIFLFFENKIRFNSIVKLGVGFLSPIFIMGAYFYSKDSLENYVYMLIEFPLQVSTYRMSFNEVKVEIYNKLNLDQSFSIELIILIALIATVLYLARNFSYKNIPNIFKLNLIISVFITLSIIAGGRLFNHYLIQLFPFVAIISAYGFNLFYKRRYFPTLILTIMFVLNFNLINRGYENLLNYENIQLNYPAKQISETLNNLDLKNKNFLVLESHIIYLYNDNITPFKVVHPSNLPNTFRYKEILNSLSKLQITFENEFDLYVQNKPHYILCEVECNLYINQEFYEENYNLIVEIDELKLFQRNN